MYYQLACTLTLISQIIRLHLEASYKRTSFSGHRSPKIRSMPSRCTFESEKEFLGNFFMVKRLSSQQSLVGRSRRTASFFRFCSASRLKFRALTLCCLLTCSNEARRKTSRFIFTKGALKINNEQLCEWDSEYVLECSRWQGIWLYFLHYII